MTFYAPLSPLLMIVELSPLGSVKGVAQNQIAVTPSSDQIVPDIIPQNGSQGQEAEERCMEDEPSQKRPPQGYLHHSHKVVPSLLKPQIKTRSIITNYLNLGRIADAQSPPGA
jgi:hypothetical protein